MIKRFIDRLLGKPAARVPLGKRVDVAREDLVGANNRVRGDTLLLGQRREIRKHLLDARSGCS